MWAIDNQTPYATHGAFVRDRDGSEIWLVAVRATYNVSPTGACSLSATQEPVALVPQYRGEPCRSSLRCDTDLPRLKPGTDVLINGSAHVPHGRAATKVTVSLTVGPICKRLVVWGERCWTRGSGGGLIPSSPEPFTTLPITYERAFGGAAREGAHGVLARLSEENPVGVGLDAVEGGPVANIEYPDSSIHDAASGARPAGFGALERSWMPRRRLAGTYDDAWERDRRPLEPSDFEDAFFHAAPSDQRVEGHLQGGEILELTQMTPDDSLRIVLPRLALGFRTTLGGRQVYHRGLLHTVLLEPDRGRLVMVWHTSLPCHHALYTLDRTLVYEKEFFPRRATFDGAIGGRP